MPKRIVHIGVVVPESSSISSSDRIEAAFADEADARAWAREWNQYTHSAFGAYRRVVSIEVKPKRRAAAREGGSA